MMILTSYSGVFLKYEFHFSDVKKLFIVFVLLSILDGIPSINGDNHYIRDSRKLFGGYRITPTYCKASRASKYNRGNTICMFNHECVQRGGEVVGACMDGFLFGACCQLKSDSQSHIPKGPGVIMTSYIDYPDADPDEEFDESDQINAWHSSFKPIVTPGYRPTNKNNVATKSPEPPSHISTQSLSSEIISEGLSQITNSLLHNPTKDSNVIFIRPGQHDNIYSQSTAGYDLADTYLINKNGSEVDNVVRPSDFNIQLSSLETKQTTKSTITTTTAQPTKAPTTKPYVKPVFKPKPSTKPSNKPIVTKTPTTSHYKPISTTEKYVIIPTVTKLSQNVTELTSMQSPAITSIIQMLNESTPSLNKESATTAVTIDPETKSSPAPTPTVDPVPYSSGYPNYYISTGHYVTLKPSSIHQSTTSLTSHTTKKPNYNSNKYSTLSTVNEVQITSSKPYYSSSIPSQSSSHAAIDAFNRYPTNPSNFDNSVTTFSYISSSTTTRTPSTTTRRPPSTSYVFGLKPARRPATPSSNLPNYDIAPESFASVTPTVIVLDGFQTTKPETTSAGETQFVEISQEPFKKPSPVITINNHIESTNNIFMGKPQSQFAKPSSPTVVITPKPSPTTPFPLSHSTSQGIYTPSYLGSSSYIYESSTESLYSPTTFKPELQTSPDDLINFPPVRNPGLPGSVSNLYTNNTSLSDNEIEALPDVEFTTPSFQQEDEKLKEKMNLFVNKIVGSLQGTFQELHDIVILDKKPNATIIRPDKPTTSKPTRKPVTTRRPTITTKKPIRATTKKPKPTTKKPAKLTTIKKTPTTTALPTTTRRAATTTKKSKPVRKVTTTPATSTTTELEDITTESLNDAAVDYSDEKLCGIRPMVKSGRIVGGKNAKFGEYPWQVLVRESTWLGLFTKNKCGGVLITNKFVTTAAHCQPGFLATLVVVFGENDISGDTEPKRPVSKNVKRIIVHRQYDAATFENDLAILELESPVRFDSHIVPICMPPDEADFTGNLATVTGWGRLKYGGGVPAVLQEVQVPVIENSVCQEMFQKAGHTKIILRSFLCAGYVNGQKDSCEGDSGGPLVLQRDDGKWQLVGTVSHGIKCAAPYLPGVYMRTTYYKPWLKTVTKMNWL